MTVLDELLSLDLTQLKHEHQYLTAVHDWALAGLNLDYETGDRVEICHLRPSQSSGGWKCYAEALAIGQTGIAGKISFNSYAGGWDVLVGMDRCWSVSEWSRETKRYWYGPPSEMPEGYEPTYDLEKYPEGKVKYFSMRVEWVRKAPVAGDVL